MGMPTSFTYCKILWLYNIHETKHRTDGTTVNEVRSKLLKMHAYIREVLDRNSFSKRRAPEGVKGAGAP